MTAVNTFLAHWADDGPMDNGNGKRLFSSTELTSGAGCTRKALRYYQDKGLVSPIRDVGNQRYDLAAFNRLRLIVALRDAGIEVEQIAELLDTRRKHHPGPASPVAEAVSGELDQLIRSLNGKIDALSDIRERLVRARETLGRCKECDRSLDDCVDCAVSETLEPTSRALMT